MIPTYKRPERVLDAITTLISSTDKRFNVICSSNCYEPDLEFLRGGDQRVFYSFFEENRGPVANIKKLIEVSTAKYSMYLSDEDTVSTVGFTQFLDFLEALDDDQHVVLCSIFDNAKNEFFFEIPPFLAERSLTLGPALCLDILPYYLSGYVYRRDMIRQSYLEQYFTESRGGVYPQRYLAIELLKTSRLAFYNGDLVLLGRPQPIYDDDFYNDASRFDSTRPPESEQYYNPFIYSASAFARQFYFGESQLFHLRTALLKSDYAFASVRYVLRMYISISLADEEFKNTVHSIRVDCDTAFQEALSRKEFSGSPYGKLFKKLCSAPPALGFQVARVCLSLIRIATSILVRLRV